MDTAKKYLGYLIWPGVVLLQLIMTQVVTFIVSLFFPNMEDFPLTHPALFVFMLGITFSIGVFVTGSLAIRQRWLHVVPRYGWRLAGTIIGAYLPLLIGLVFGMIEAGSPYFFFSIVACIAGFYAAGWTRQYK